MRDYKKEISDYLNDVLKRKEFSIDRIKAQIQNSKYVCVFGIGTISYPIISSIINLTDIKIDFLSDNDQTKWGKTFHNDLKCISPTELEKYKDDIVILITTQHYKKIYQQLLKKGFQKIFVITEYRLLNDSFFKNQQNIRKIKENMLKVMDILDDERSKEIMITLIKNWFDFDIAEIGYEDIYSQDHYFPDGVVLLNEDEVFVDAGAYIGDTLLEFIEKTNGKFDSYIAFELDSQNFKEMENAVNKMQPEIKNKIKLNNCAILDKEQEINYEFGAHGSQSSCENVQSRTININTGKAVKLSNILKNHKITFIKMDIEGAEVKALSGAEEIIKIQKPKLAISIYHNIEHLWAIPLYLKHIVPEYKIFLRHHSPLEYETVCYAIY
jgi:FkbM family methyltransferase